MLVLALLVLLATVWWLWNLHGQIRRLNDLLARSQETLALLQPEPGDDPDAGVEGDVGEPRPPIRIIVEITDALKLAERYSSVGGYAGAIAPNVLKKAIHARVLEQANNAMLESGHNAEAEVRVIVL